MEILVILLIGFIIMVIYLAISTGKRKMKLEEEGYNVKKANLSGSSLVGGHPDINAALKNVCFISNNSQIAICDITFVMKATIAKQSIKDVTFEDATTFGKRISAGRLLLVGIFALAWKKKSKNENAD